MGELLFEVLVAENSFQRIHKSDFFVKEFIENQAFVVCTNFSVVPSVLKVACLSISALDLASKTSSGIGISGITGIV